MDKEKQSNKKRNVPRSRILATQNNNKTHDRYHQTV